MSQKSQPLLVKDYDVLGVGALRRADILRQYRPVILLTHSALIPESEKEIYQAVLKETLAWLKPLEVRAQQIAARKDEFLLEALLEDFKKYFPATAKGLKGGLRELMKDYLKEVPWQGPPLTSHFRYLSVFLKRKTQDSRLFLIAQKEWLGAYLNFADFGFPPEENGRIFPNPSLQSLFTDVEIEEVSLTPGLTVFFYNYSDCKIHEYKMDLWDAVIVDSLQDDRKYTRDQILEQVQMMELEHPLSREEWVKKFAYLLSRGIILESGSEWISNS